MSARRSAVMLLFLYCASVLSQSTNFAGEYSGSQILLKLNSGAAGAYSGSLQFEGTTYPVQANAAGENRLDGTFTLDGHAFRFSALLDQSELRLTTDGAEHVLVRKAVVAASPAASARAAAVYQSATTGLSLRLPQGWSAQDQQQGVLLSPPGASIDLSREDNTEAYFALLHTGFQASGEAAFAKEVSTAFLQGGAQIIRGGTRQPMSASGRSGSLYAWDLRDPSTGKAISCDIYIFPSADRAFAVVALGETERVRSHVASLRQIASSLEHRAPQVAASGPLADNTQAAQFWLQKLRGKTVKQFITGAGTAGERVRFLAADGTYTYRSNVAIVADVPGASASALGRSANTGRWRIVDRNGQVFLQLVSNDGNTQLFSLTTSGRFWYLNGEKAFAIDPE